MKKTLFGMAIALLALNGLQAQETAPSCCGKTFMVTDQIAHFKTPGSMHVEGGRKPHDFDEQVYGPNFTASVDGLPVGKYTIEIELAETYMTSPGRTMNITSGSTELAKDLDVFTAAGGAGKMYKVTGTVDHAADSVGGPLKIQFVGTKDNAFFNAIHILDASGKSVACVAANELAVVTDPRASVVPEVAADPIYNDPDQPTDKRIDDLIRRMSLKEKVDQLIYSAPAIDRLHLPAYNYWNEGLHGVAREGVATVFPQAVGLAAMWDTNLELAVGTAIGREGRAKYNDNIRHNERGIYHGLTFWSPNINIFRDPRWGRGQETYGEDPFLTARMGVAFIEGLQGNDPKYMMAMGCAKHFAVHSGPEPLRHTFNAVVSDDDLYNTYLPQFEAAVREAKVGGVMGAYNAVDGKAACASPFLLTDILRKKWGFQGYVTSDCGAINDIFKGHQLAPDAATASAMAVKAGCDVECGDAYYSLVSAVNRKLLTEKDINLALHHLLWTRFRLGLFDPADKMPLNDLPMSEVNSPEHQALALKAARESIVLLKNQGVLPLDTAKVKKIAVIGANAADTGMLHGNYNGDMVSPVSILQGIQAAAGSDATVTFAKGCPLAMVPNDPFSENSPDFKQAVQTATDADVIIYVGGLNSDLESEEGSVSDVGFNGGDRTRIELPAIQEKMLKALVATGKTVVFVNCSGSAMAMPWEKENVPAIVQAWYPGQSGGTAVADVLFGKYNPAGRLAVTFYDSTDELPSFTDYSMANRTYRYFKGTVDFPFGFGLSYTKFDYSGLQLPTTAVARNGAVHVNVNVTNSGGRDGEEVVQVYYREKAERSGAPIRSLCGFKRVAIAKGATEPVAITIPAQSFRHWDDDKKSYVVDSGAYEIQVGSSSADTRATGVVRIQ